VERWLKWIPSPKAMARCSAARVEERVAPNANAQMLVGPVTTVTGSPATSFTQVVRQQIGPAATAAPIETDTITVASSTTFLLPGAFRT